MISNTLKTDKIDAGVESISGCLMQGWACYAHQKSTHLKVQLWIDGEMLKTKVANQRLILSQHPSARYQSNGFAIYLPRKFRDGQKHAFQLMDESGRELLYSGSFGFINGIGELYFDINRFSQEKMASPQFTPLKKYNLISKETKKISLFTIASKNYLPYVRMLFSSVAKIHPDYKLHLLLVDKNDEYIELNKEPYNIIEVQNIGIDFMLDMSLRYDIMEFNTAVKPFMFKWLFENTDTDAIIYLDPDIYVYSKMSRLEEILNSDTSIVLTPHITEPLEDGKIPDDYNMLQAGVFNLGFIAARRCDEAIAYFNWWGRRLQTQAIANFSLNLFTDQRWCDLAPCFLNNLKILKDAAYNVAYWNLPQRPLSGTAENGWFINDAKLVFFHFSGVNPLNPKSVSKHQNRLDWSEIAEYTQLFSNYLDGLLNCGWKTTRYWPYAYNAVSTAFTLHPLIRALYRESHATPAEIAGLDLEKYLSDICNSRANISKVPAGRWISRLAWLVYTQRADLQKAFDVSSLSGHASYISWFVNTAKSEYGFPASVSTFSHRNSVVSVDNTASLPQLLPGKKITTLLHILWNSRRDLQAAFDLSTFSGQLSFLKWCFSSCEREYNISKSYLERTVNHEVAYEAGSGVIEGNEGANLIGYAHAELGMGEHVRMSAEALLTTDVSFGVYNFDVGVASRKEAKLANCSISDKNDRRANIFHINADQMFNAYTQLGREFFSNRYNIGYWAWELSKCPEEWVSVIDLVDEIWAPSKFIQNAFKAKTTKPVIYMPLCVTLPKILEFHRNYFNLPESDFLFLYTFDFFSYVERKNPVAAILAFKSAFKNLSDRVGLVIKVMNGDENDARWKSMLQVIERDARITIINRTMDRDEVLGLFSLCDCFVSLHRSEGFGRGPAEAMHMGKPVIVTNYSGNTDFTLSHNACLVNYELIPVKVGQYVFEKDQVWADPDIEHAAWYMRQLWMDKAYARDIGIKGQRYISENFSPAVVGNLYKERLYCLGLI
jgi:glycosyltransferase involved in cell wall biosynthesis